MKVTIYSKSDFFGIRRVEARLVDHGTRRYAQYNNAPWVHFVPKRKRNIREIIGDFHPWIVILEGHGHPDASNFKAPRVEKGFVTQEAKYLSCDERYETDMDAVLDRYCEETGTAVVADYRYTKGFNPHVGG